MYPGPRFEGFLGIADPSRVKNGLVKPRSNLVNSGQTWSKLSELWEMYPGPRFEGFLGIADPNRVKNGLVKLGQLRSTLVKLGQI